MKWAGDTMHRLLRDKKTIFFLILPGLLFFSFAILFPILLSGYYSLTNWSGMGSPHVIGFDNYKNLIFNDPTFWKSLEHALLLGAALVLLQHPVGFLFAVMLDKLGGKLEKVFRTIIFIPCVISVIVTSKMWASIYDPQFGLLNKVLDMLHLGSLKQEWLADPKFVLGSLVVIIMWQGFGWCLLIYYSGYKGIPEDVFEAAKIDGAGKVRILTNITVPLMSPVIAVNVTLAIISALKQMETVYLTTNGGPGDVSQFLANYLYIKAFNSFEYGYGNAISVLFVFACLLSTFLLNRIFKRSSYEY